MKKFLSMLAIILLMGLVTGCVEQNNNSESDSAEAPSNEENSISITSMTNEELSEKISYHGLNEDDELVSVDVSGNEVKLVIELSESELISKEDHAKTSYSQISDYLLELDGWETLSVEYLEVGQISLNVQEKETNEFGMTYFPMALIEEKFETE